MLQRLACCATLLLATSSPVRADDPSDGLFDLPIGCENTHTEVEHEACVYRANERADRELNAKYQELQKLADEREKAYLRDMQRAWIALRDAQCSLERDYHEGSAHFSMWKAHCEAVMTLRRVKELEQLGTGIRWHAEDRKR